MFPINRPYCGNCGNDCCCECERRDTCFYCKRGEQWKCVEIDSAGQPTKYVLTSADRRCSQFNCGYLQHYVCFDCCYGFKRGAENMTKCDANVACSKCGKEAIEVPFNVRTPKASNKKMWEHLKKLLCLDVFKDCKKNTIGYLWYKISGFEGTVHMARENRSMFKIPQRPQDYENWVTYMKTTWLSKK